MSNIKWIKLSTSMFEDEKIKLIESLPEADTILIIWIKLLSLAGKTNATGGVYLNENIPYTDEMLATIFDRPLQTVRLALTTFEQYGMIDITNHNFIFIANWEKHQNVEGMEKIREQNRLRKQKQRERERQVQLEMSRDSHVTITESHATEEDKELDKEIDIQKETEKEKYQSIFQYWNEKNIIKHRTLSTKTASKIKARLNNFSVEELQQAIDHYHTVLTRPEYFWEYRWSLQDFLRSDENVEKFLDIAYLKGLRKKGFQNNSAFPTSQSSGQLPTAKGISENQVDVDDIYAELGDDI
ncbi:replication protein [Bacillus cereus]|uniref:Replication protein n=1 Tax=Bacillus cereus TaxID=1396 RepID=A0A9X7GTQ0_BACCE|nr:phage replisome organizer N-terminal domain-containing protein [Bacillus cereus]PGS69053.1 replication protein [Bacillus cereus]